MVVLVVLVFRWLWVACSHCWLILYNLILDCFHADTLAYISICVNVCLLWYLWKFGPNWDWLNNDDGSMWVGREWHESVWWCCFHCWFKVESFHWLVSTLKVWLRVEICRRNFKCCNCCVMFRKAMVPVDAAAVAVAAADADLDDELSSYWGGPDVEDIFDDDLTISNLENALTYRWSCLGRVL